MDNYIVKSDVESEVESPLKKRISLMQNACMSSALRLLLGSFGLVSSGESKFIENFSSNSIWPSLSTCMITIEEPFLNVLSSVKKSLICY